MRKSNPLNDPCICKHKRRDHYEENDYEYAICRLCKPYISFDDNGFDHIHDFKLDPFKFLTQNKSLTK